MKIGVISDTHLAGYSEALKQAIDLHFADVDLVLHAGDITSLSVLDMFGDREVKAVRGNMDYLETGLPQKLEFTLRGIRFGLMHGWGNPYGLRERLRKEFGEIDCLVYGHTHQAFNETQNGVLYFNPGAASEGFFRGKKTVGILKINGGISGQIIEIGL